MRRSGHGVAVERVAVGQLVQHLEAVVGALLDHLGDGPDGVDAPRHLAGETSLEEIRFVLFGEPAYRVFEMVNDAAKVAEQMAKLATRERRQ